jgi:excisionase family DNA binding protein
VARIRVYELARELKAESRAVLATLAEMGHPLPSAASLVQPSVVTRLREQAPALKGLSPPRAPSTSGHWNDAYADDESDEDSYRHPDDLVTAVQAASMCGVKPATIRQWVSRGHLTSDHRSGRRDFYRAGDVLAAQARVNHHKQARPSSRINLPAHHRSALITAAEAARLLGVSPSTIRMWVNRGHLAPTVRTSRPYLFTVGAVLLAANRQRPARSVRDE